MADRPLRALQPPSPRRRLVNPARSARTDFQRQEKKWQGIVKVRDRPEAEGHRNRFDVANRRKADVADRRLGRHSWAESVPTGVALRRTGVRAKAVLPLQAGSKLYRFQRTVSSPHSSPPGPLAPARRMGIIVPSLRHPHRRRGHK